MVPGFGSGGTSATALPDVGNELQGSIAELNDLAGVGSYRRTAMKTYKTFQATKKSSCNCKYEYEGTADHSLLHAYPDETDARALERWATQLWQGRQGPITTRLLQSLFAHYDGFTDPAAAPRALEASPAVPEDLGINLVLVNEYVVDGQYIPWHHDHMELSARNAADEEVVPVLGYSYGASAPFCYMPNRSEPEFWARCCGGRD